MSCLALVHEVLAVKAGCPSATGETERHGHDEHAMHLSSGYGKRWRGLMLKV